MNYTTTLVVFATRSSQIALIFAATPCYFLGLGTDAQILSDSCAESPHFCIHSCIYRSDLHLFCQATLLAPLGGIQSALLLLVLGVLANDHHATLALNHLALLADGFHGRSYFHGAASLLHPIAQLFERQVIRPLVRS